MLYLSYIQRQIDLKLADAIRAGTIFKFGFRENYIFLDVFTYSDILEKIIKIIKEIITSIEYITFEENYYLYKDYALENLANFYNENLKNILKYEFYTHISIKDNRNFPPIYNIYLFPQDDFLNSTDKNLKPSYISNIFFPIMNIYILGYYERNETKKFLNLHKNFFNTTSFSSTLREAEYDTSQPFITNGDNFIRYVTTRQNLTGTKTFNNITRIKDNKKHVFMSFAQFSDNNRIPVEIFRRIIEEAHKDKIWLEVTNQKIIYLRISFHKDNDTKVIKKILMKTVNDKKENMMKPLDIIGGRFYYLIRNLENKYTKTPDNIEDATLALTYDQIYNRTCVHDYKIDPDNYDVFNNTISSFFNQNQNYCEFSNK